jgi:hypothetical protein
MAIDGGESLGILFPESKRRTGKSPVSKSNLDGTFMAGSSN